MMRVRGKIVHLWGVILACLLLPVSAFSQNQIYADSTAFGDVVVLEYDRPREQVYVATVDRSGQLNPGGILSLSVFTSPPEIIGFAPQRTGEIDLVVNVATPNVREIALLRMRPDGSLADLSYTRSGNRFVSHGVAGHNGGVVVAGSVLKRGSQDTGASLTFLAPAQAPIEALRDTPGQNERYIAVVRPSPSRMVALGLREGALGRTALFMSEFTGTLQHVRDWPVGLGSGHPFDSIIAVPLEIGGFLVLYPDETDPKRFHLVQLDINGNVKFEQAADFSLAAEPRDIIDLRDGRYAIDMTIPDRTGQGTAGHGRMLALMRAGQTAPTLAFRNIYAAVVASPSSRAALMELVASAGDTIVLQQLVASDFDYATTWVPESLPEVGIGGLEVLSNETAGRAFVLTQDETRSCQMHLTEEGGFASAAITIDASQQPLAIAYHDNTLAIVGNGITQSNGMPRQRIDLRPIHEQDPQRVAARINRVIEGCRI